MKFLKYIEKTEKEKILYEKKVKIVKAIHLQTSINKKLGINDIIKASPNYWEAIKYKRKGGLSFLIYQNNYMYFLANPKIHTKPKNTYHELIMNNSLNWKKYPDINKSINVITSHTITTKTKDKNYSYIFPNNNVKMGLGTNPIFEDCFSRIDKSFEQFDKDLQYILNLSLNSKKVYKNIDDLKKACDNFNIWIKSENAVFTKRLENIKWFKKWNGEGSFFDYIQFTLDPTPNGFKLVDLHKKIRSDSKLVWFDSDAIGVRQDKIIDFYNKLKVKK